MSFESKNQKYLYITTPVFYPSDKPHLGHALTAVISDCLKRYYQQMGYKCFLSTGTDEHGEKIARCAEELNLPVDVFVEKYVETFKLLWEKLGINYDKFIRTSDPRHIKIVENIFKDFRNKNLIFLDHWHGWYCSSCEENYSFHSVKKKTKCNLGHPLLEKNEKSFFLKVSSFKDWIKKQYEEKEKFIFPPCYKKELINNFLNQLHDLSISRRKLVWGIKVPEDHDYTIYVWFDALLNYLSAINFGDISDSLFQNYWESKNTKIIHVIGKEIVRFHGIYWPIILKNLNLRQFDSLLVHGWLLIDNEKMSKSKKNVEDPIKLLEFIKKDSLRFYLASINWYQDHIFQKKEILITHNTLLSNTYGNLISRFFGLISRKYNFQIPNNWDSSDYVSIANVNIELDKLVEEYEKIIFDGSIPSFIEKLFQLLKKSARIIEDEKVWELAPDNSLSEALTIFIYKLLCFSTWSLSPILIDVCPEIMKNLVLNSEELDVEYFTNIRNFCNKILIAPDCIFFPRYELTLLDSN